MENQLEIMQTIKTLWEGECNGKKVSTIKEIQNKYGLSLLEAKNIVDEYLNNKEMYDVMRTKNHLNSIPNKINIEEKDNTDFLTVDNINKSGNELLKEYKQIRKVVYNLMEAQDKLGILIEQLNAVKEKENKYRNKIGIFTTIFFIIGAFAFIFSFSNPSILIIIVGFIDMIIITTIGGYIDKIRNTEEKFENQAKNVHENEVIPLLKEIEEEKKIIELIWDSEEMKLYEKNIPEEYSNLETLDFFIHALEIGRASSKKELINLYEEELHRKRLEETQNKILNVQQEQLEVSNKNANELSKINKKQRKISRQVRYGNTIDTLNFLLKK